MFIHDPRAMRNRGVEIYMLGPKEKVDYNAIDLKSLLFNVGITSSAHRDALLEIYNRTSNEIVAVDTFSVVDLLHTAFLVRQRSLRGFPAERSIKDACIDVYVKTRQTRDRQFKQQLAFLIDEIMERSVARDKEFAAIDLDAATWSVKNLQDNTRLTIIRQQGLLINAAIRMYKMCLNTDAQDVEGSIATTKFLNDFCGFKEDEELASNVDIADILLYFLLNFYERSSRNDALLRMAWVSKILQENGIFNELEETSALMAEEIASFHFRSANVSSLPLDLQEFVGKVTDKDDIVYSDANRLILLLYAHGMIFKNEKAELMDVKMLKKKNVISVKEYSNFVHNGKVS